MLADVSSLIKEDDEMDPVSLAARTRRSEHDLLLL